MEQALEGGGTAVERAEVLLPCWPFAALARAAFSVDWELLHSDMAMAQHIFRTTLNRALTVT